MSELEKKLRVCAAPDNLIRPAPDLLLAAADQLKRYREALEPFVAYLNEVKFDLDNNGNESPDEQGVGWIYLTNGDFRRARQALEQDQ